jgi:hypothetical protein
MQSNVTVPASGSKFKLWLLIVVLAVAIFGGAAYGYYSWYKSNEPPPSLATKDGSGLQGLMKIQEGDIKGFAKLEEADVKDKVCSKGAMTLSGNETAYLYSTSESTFKDFYDSILVKENVGKIFLFVFYSPGEDVGVTVPTKYNTGFYLFPTPETGYKASHVELGKLADYKIPAYRTVMLFHDKEMKVCRDGKATPAIKVDQLSNEEGVTLEANLKPFPKGWILVPFGWNSNNVVGLNAMLENYISSMWVVKAGDDGAVKVKKGNESLLVDALESSKTRSVWMNMKDKGTDLIKVMKGKDKEGHEGEGEGEPVKDTVAPSIVSAGYVSAGDSAKIDVVFSEEFKDYTLSGICEVIGLTVVDCIHGAPNLVVTGIVKGVDTSGAKMSINLKNKLDEGFYKVSFSTVSDSAGNIGKDVAKTFEAVPVVKKKKGETCEKSGDCEGVLECVKSEEKTVCWEANTDEAICSVCKDLAKCKVVNSESDPVNVTCEAEAAPKGDCTKQTDCTGGSHCIAHAADEFICKTDEQIDAVCPEGMTASFTVPVDGGPATVNCSETVVKKEAGQACAEQADCKDGIYCIAHTADAFICKTQEQIDAVCPEGMTADFNG